MSSGTGVWRQTIARATQLRARGLGIATSQASTVDVPNTSITALAHQIFFASIPRTRVLFVTPDAQVEMPAFCERIGRAVVAISRARVVFVVGNSGSSPVESGSATDLGGSLWRFPLELYETHLANGNASEERLRFDYTIFGASISDSAAPLFCKASDGIVLVVAANQTHREAALRAKDILHSWNVELLGAVLDNRTFPVPESIYRRL